MTRALVALTALLMFLFDAESVSSQSAPDWKARCTAFTLLSTPTPNGVPSEAIQLAPNNVLRSVASTVLAEDWPSTVDTLLSRAMVYEKTLERERKFDTDRVHQLTARLARLRTELATGVAPFLEDLRPKARGTTYLLLVDSAIGNVSLREQDDSTLGIPLCWIAQSTFRLAYEAAYRTRREDARTIRQAEANYRNLREHGYSQFLLERPLNGCVFSDAMRKYFHAWLRSGCSSTSLNPDRNQIVALHPSVGTLIRIGNGRDSLFRTVGVVEIIGLVRYKPKYDGISLGAGIGGTVDGAGRRGLLAMVASKPVRLGVGSERVGGRRRLVALLNIDVYGLSGTGRESAQGDRVTRMANYLVSRAR
jgi:hypothetical protein